MNLIKMLIEKCFTFNEVKRYWNNRKRGVKTIDLERGSGYYLCVGFINDNQLIGKISEIEMRSGNIGLYELISYKTYPDPSDMIRNSYWHMVGYKYRKPINDCKDFNEFIETSPEFNRNRRTKCHSLETK